jgi:hypothetical protein
MMGYRQDCLKKISRSCLLKISFNIQPSKQNDKLYDPGKLEFASLVVSCIRMELPFGS